MIKTITIEAVSIKPNKKDGTPYMWKDKKTNAMKPRTMVSLKYKDATTGTEGEWLMGWSYKAGSAAEALTAGQTVEIKYEESAKVNPDGTTTVFKGWRFPKQEDKDAALIEQLKAQLAAAQQPLTSGVVNTPITAQATPVATPITGATANAAVQIGIHNPTPLVTDDGSVPVSDVPF